MITRGQAAANERQITIQWLMACYETDDYWTPRQYAEAIEDGQHVRWWSQEPEDDRYDNTMERARAQIRARQIAEENRS